MSIEIGLCSSKLIFCWIKLILKNWLDYIEFEVEIFMFGKVDIFCQRKKIWYKIYGFDLFNNAKSRVIYSQDTDD